MKQLRYVILSLVACICLTGAVTASAADERLGMVIDGSLLTENSSVETECTIGNSLARGTYLSGGKGKLSLISDQTLNIYGATFCYQSVDKVKVKVYLQKLVDGSWNTVYISSTKVATDTYFVSTSINKTVEGGYYYRMGSTHIVIEGDTTESTSSYSDALWVD